MCVWLKFKSAFSTCSSSVLKCLSPAQNPIVSSTKSVHLQHKIISSVAVNAFVCSVISYSEIKRVLFESWCRNSQKRKGTREKSFQKNFISSRVIAVKGQKQSRDENTQEDHTTSKWWQKRKTWKLPWPCCMSFFSTIFPSLPCFYTFCSSIPTWNEVFFQKLSPLVHWHW